MLNPMPKKPLVDNPQRNVGEGVSCYTVPKMIRVPAYLTILRLIPNPLEPAQISADLWTND